MTVGATARAGQETGQFQTALVLGGHAPLPAGVEPADRAPMEYEKAVQALQACQTIEDARYFGNKADALAAWAKIYNDERAATAARVLKLHAYRRIGILAEQLRPTVKGQKGPASLLRDQGFKHHQAQAAIAVAGMPEKEFRREVSKPVPRAPGMLVQVDLRKNPKAAVLSARFQGLLSCLRKAKLRELVGSMDDADARGCQARIDELLRLIAELQKELRGRRSRA